jgi:hypothetical protein
MCSQLDDEQTKQDECGVKSAAKKEGFATCLRVVRNMNDDQIIDLRCSQILFSLQCYTPYPKSSLFFPHHSSTIVTVAKA